MTTPATTFPDIELVLTGWLRTYLGAAAGRVVTVTPTGTAFAASLPIVRINRIGGIWRPLAWGASNPAFDEATVQVDIWHTDLAELWTVVGQTRTAFAALPGEDVTGASFGEVREVAGPARLPEDDPKVYRIGFTAGLLVRPA